MRRTHPLPELLLLVALAILAPATMGAAGAAGMPAGPPDGCGTPVAVVETLHGALLEAMQGGEALGFQGRYELIEPVVELTFDVELMGSKSVGRHWKTLSEADKALWLGKFRSYIAASFAGNFKKYEGERFETLGEKAAAKETRVVLTKMRVPKKDDVVFNYRVKESARGWQIIDIYLKGTVSELALRRSDFSTTLKNDGFQELASAIDRKIAEIRQEADG